MRRAPAIAAAVTLAALTAAIARADHPGTAAGGVERLGPPAPPAPRRIVSLAPSLTDMVVAMGRSSLLVGVTRYDDAGEVTNVPRVGGFLDPSPEAVLAVRPDLVLWMTDGGALPAVRRIASAGVPVLAIPVINVVDVLASARVVGEAIGARETGDRLASSLAQAVARARERGAARGRIRVLFVVGRDPLVVAGPGSYPDELLQLAGGVNVVEGQRAWPVYPIERAVAADPSLVIDAAVQEPPDSIHRLDAIPAVRSGRVYRLHDDTALRPGPRLPRALEELDSALARAHP